MANLSGVRDLDLGPDGAIYARQDNKIQRLGGGTPPHGDWPKGAPGERVQFLDGYWFGHSWHGTIRRFAGDLTPDPGVVLGGGSGSFIGHLDQNPEVSNGRGMARLGEHLYAVSGIAGVMHLLAWDVKKQQFRIVRRIGAVPTAGGIGLDRSGNVWWHAGTWRWDDRPDAPLANGISPTDSPGVGQAVMLENDRMVAPGFQWGKPCLYHGPLTDELRAPRIKSGCGLPRNCVATAVYGDGNQLRLLAITAAGQGIALAIDPDGSYRGDDGPVVLKTSPVVSRWTSLAMKDACTLLGAGGGQVIEMTREGRDWKETRRWNSWPTGGSDHLGATIHLAVDAGRLWIADQQRHRVLVFDLATGKMIAAFGVSDQPGTDLQHLCSPAVVAARGDRAVVHDAGNQRLVKLQLKP